LKHADRHSTYSDNYFVPQNFNVQWLSIVNSVVLVFLLTMFMGIIMIRILRNDFHNYMELDDEIGGLNEQEEQGWKLVHGDVFRFPQNKSLYCAALGAGSHLAFATFGLLVSALLGFVSITKRGSILTAMLILYSLGGVVGGFVSGSMFKQMGGVAWVRTLILTSLIFPAPLMIVFSWVNTVAIAQNSTAALPFGTIVTILCLFCFICFPATVVGGILGRNFAKDFGAPVRTNKVAREIPEGVWYRSPPIQVRKDNCPIVLNLAVCLWASASEDSEHDRQQGRPKLTLRTIFFLNLKICRCLSAVSSPSLRHISRCTTSLVVSGDTKSTPCSEFCPWHSS